MLSPRLGTGGVERTDLSRRSRKNWRSDDFTSEGNVADLRLAPAQADKSLVSPGRDYEAHTAPTFTATASSPRAATSCRQSVASPLPPARTSNSRSSA